MIGAMLLGYIAGLSTYWIWVVASWRVERRKRGRKDWWR